MTEKRAHILRLLLPVTIVFIVIALLFPHNGIFRYDYSKGGVWKYDDLSADIDFPILKTAEEIERERREISQSAIPFFRMDRSVALTAQKTLELARMDSLQLYRPALASKVRNILLKGVLPDGSADSLPDLCYVQKDRRAEKVPAKELYTLSRACQEYENAVYGIAGGDAEALLTLLPAETLIQVNLTQDNEISALLRRQELKNVSPTSGMVRAGEHIIRKGETITGELAQILDSYKAEYSRSIGSRYPAFLVWIGGFLVALFLCVLLLSIISAVNPAIFNDYGKYTYLITMFGLTVLSIIFVARMNTVINPLAFPFMAFALFMHAFFGKRIILPVYIISLLPMLLYLEGGVQLFIIYVGAGFVGIYGFSRFGKGYKQFILGLLIYVYMVFAYLTMSIVTGSDLSSMDFVAMLGGSILFIFVYPLVYLFEIIFSLVSSSRLMDLCDGNHPLVQQLSAKAPGTFQHSLQVMNMSSDVAAAIDADVPLVKAGAMYHDVGKMVNPQCFVENNTTASDGQYHKGLTPKDSAMEIIRHVSDGLALAHKHGLPKVVCEFIATHHGTSSTGYFYTQYINDGGDPADAGAFFYPGPRPTTKEQVIVSLCDSIEAASRTLKSYSPEEIDAFVERMVQSKIDAGQLDDALISLHELGIVKARLKKYLEELYHKRVAYPKQKTKK